MFGYELKIHEEESTSKISKTNNEKRQVLTVYVKSENRGVKCYKWSRKRKKVGRNLNILLDPL